MFGEHGSVRAWDDVSESRHSVAFEIGFRKLYPAITPAHCILSDSDPPPLPSFPLEPSAAGAQPAGLQPRESVAAAGVTQANRELVAHEFAATTGEDGRTAGETCSLLLATPGGRTSDAAAVRGDAGPDRTASSGARAAQFVRRWPPCRLSVQSQPWRSVKPRRQAVRAARLSHTRTGSVFHSDPKKAAELGRKG